MTTLSKINSRKAIANHESVSDALISSWDQGSDVGDYHWTNSVWSPTLGIFAMVSYERNYILTSRDGINWNSHACPAGRNVAICWSNELNLFVVVGGDYYNSSLAGIMTSSDGVTWTQRVNSTYKYTNVTWNGSIFVAAHSFDVSARFAYSTNGTSWTNAAPVAIGGVNLSNITWSPTLGIFLCAVTGGAGTYNILTSSNGITWTANIGPKMFNVTWSESLGIFCGSASGQIHISIDGINWSTTSEPIKNDITWVEELNRFYGINYSGDTICTSPDGINWTSKPLPDKSYGTLSWSPELLRFCTSRHSDSITNTIAYTDY